MYSILWLLYTIKTVLRSNRYNKIKYNAYKILIESLHLLFYNPNVQFLKLCFANVAYLSHKRCVRIHKKWSHPVKVWIYFINIVKHTEHFYLLPADRPRTVDYKMPNVRPSIRLCVRASVPRFTKSSLSHSLLKIYSSNLEIMFMPTITCLLKILVLFWKNKMAATGFFRLFLLICPYPLSLFRIH